MNEIFEYKKLKTSLLILLVLVGLYTLVAPLEKKNDLTPRVTKTVSLRATKKALSTRVLRVSEAITPTEYKEPVIVLPTPVATVAVMHYAVGCEQFRSLIAQYPWPVETAILVCNKESSGNVNARHVNTNGSVDSGLYQLNNNPIYEAAANIKVAYQKYEAGRVGSNNFSAWYAVCTPGNNPQPKYPGVKCI